MGQLDITRRLFERAASAQAGIFSGDNPTKYNASDPIRLWVIQLIIIIAMCQGLSLAFSRIRQPRVISEVIGGVILGPTIMGRIPGFQRTIFPSASMPLLNLTATIGLVLFLFLVGLEIDTSIIKRNARSSIVISIVGLVVPLGLGAALGVGVYREFISPSVNFGYFVLFTAVAVGITAFPVLCRILTELKLLDTTVGVVTLSAGVGNDVVGWILLALTVALVNASNSLTALYVLLTSVAFVLFLLFPVKYGYRWLARRTGSLETGQPTALMMTVTLLVVFTSAFFTDVIGVHAIFGGFLAGLIVPHDNGYAIALVEKIEDLVTILLLPIYFTLSGLKTNLGLLNNGVTWGYTFLICLVAFSAKFLSCFSAAKFYGFTIRESGAIGTLMSCKGLVELIVLNVGLQAKILDDRTFSMFVVHAIILTFITTPLTLAFYPEEYRSHSGYGTAREKPRGELEEGRAPLTEDIKTKFALLLDKIEQLPAAMTLTQLLQPLGVATSSKSFHSGSSAQSEQISEVGHAPTPDSPTRQPQIRIDALRLIELTARTSAVLRSQEAESLMRSDPVISIFRTFGYLNRLLVSTALSVVNYDDFSAAVADHVRESESDMLIVPWSRFPHLSGGEQGKGMVHNPFDDGVFGKSAGADLTNAVVYTDLLRKIFRRSPSDVALFVDRGVSGVNPLCYSGGTVQHLFLPFFGGPDDRLALSFVVQLCGNSNVTATVVRMTKTEDDLQAVNTTEDEKAAFSIPQITTTAQVDTVYANRDTQTRLTSETADNLIWDRYTISSEARSPVLSAALSRIAFSRHASSRPLHAVIELASAVTGKPVLAIVVGRSRRLAVETHTVELRALVAERGSNSIVGSEMSKTLGEVGAALVAMDTKASLLIMQAQHESG